MIECPFKAGDRIVCIQCPGDIPDRASPGQRGRVRTLWPSLYPRSWHLDVDWDGEDDDPMGGTLGVTWPQDWVVRESEYKGVLSHLKEGRKP